MQGALAAEALRNFKAVSHDIAEGFVTVNPLYLKPFNQEEIRMLFKAIQQAQRTIRAEPFPFNDTRLIHRRNMRLQRLHVATVIIKNHCREKRFSLI